MIHDLIGRPYKLGADGTEAEIDCIHLVYAVLGELNISLPSFKQSWYSASAREIMKDLREWGYLVDGPYYDGDITVIKQPDWAFGVVWEGGLLHIHRLSERVTWTSLANLTKVRCYRTKSKLLK